MVLFAGQELILQVPIQHICVTQKLIIKSALQKHIRYSTDLLFQNFAVLDVRQLFIKVLILYSFKNNFGFLERHGHRYLTRRQQNVGIITPRITKTISTTSSYYIAHVIFEKLPEELRVPGSYSLAVYKRRVDQWLLGVGRVASAAMLASDYSL